MLVLLSFLAASLLESSKINHNVLCADVTDELLEESVLKGCEENLLRWEVHGGLCKKQYFLVHQVPNQIWINISETRNSPDQFYYELMDESV